jgi:hypothetical protein
MVNELTASFLFLFSHSWHVMPCGHAMLCFVPLSSVALFSSAEKASLFLPYAEDKGSCTIITSATGKLIDVDVEAVKKAVSDFELAPSFALAAL